MYGETTGSALASQYLAAAAPQTPPPEARPLTSEIMSRLEAAIDSANRSHAQLYELRNRMFGFPPENAQGLAKSSPSGFADAYRDRATTLAEMLMAIEGLSNEIANRL